MCLPWMACSAGHCAHLRGTTAAGGRFQRGLCRSTLLGAMLLVCEASAAAVPRCDRHWQIVHQRGGVLSLNTPVGVCGSLGSAPALECMNGSRVDMHHGGEMEREASSSTLGHQDEDASLRPPWCRCVKCPYPNRCMPDGGCTVGAVGVGCSSCSSGAGEQEKQRYYNMGGRCFKCSKNYMWDMLWSLSGTAMFMFVL